MKLRVFFLIICLVIFRPVFAEGTQAEPAQTGISYQNIPFEDCTKMYTMNKSDLFYLTLGAINSNQYKIEELQTNNGYLIFSASRNKYLATIAEIDKNNSILKITPCNNLYYFQPIIVNDIYKYIDQNKDILNE